MKDELFHELVASVREGGAILRGETQPSRAFAADGPDIKHLRATYQPTFRTYPSSKWHLDPEGPFGGSVGTEDSFPPGSQR